MGLGNEPLGDCKSGSGVSINGASSVLCTDFAKIAVSSGVLPSSIFKFSTLSGTGTSSDTDSVSSSLVNLKFTPNFS